MRSVLIFALLLFTSSVFSQKKWSLRDCVAYALDHNINIRQTEVDAQVAGLTYKQSRLSRYPTLSFTNNDGFSFGKSQNPSTGILENQNYFTIGLNLVSSVEIFNWFSRRNAMLANEWNMLASKASLEKLKYDIELSVANAYLQVLLANEQQGIAGVQVEQSISQLEIVRKQVDAGALPELNAIEIEAQLANDSANYITSAGNVTQAILVLKSYMNLDAAVDFEVETPTVEEIPLEPIGELRPDAVYLSALQNLPQVKVDQYNLLAGQKSVLASRGQLYPSISAFGSLSTNYGHFRMPRYEQILTGYAPNGMIVPDGAGGYKNVEQPQFQVGNRNGFIKGDPIGKQFNQNFGQQIGISLTVPIFNGWQSRAAYERSRLNVKNLEYQQQLNNENLKQEIYQAYNAAVVAREKFTSSEAAVDAAQKSYDFSTKRFNVGMLTTLEQITNQNNLFKAKLQYVLNQYDYIFKMKILEFYRGQGIKL